MKKTLVALAALASVSAFAQSSVTISGNFDAGYSHTKSDTPGASKDEVAANGSSTSLVRFEGSEDLGGGLKAGFAGVQLISPVSGQTGNSSTTAGYYTSNWFNDEIWVGLTSEKAGSLKVGAPNAGLYETMTKVAQPYGTALGGGYSSSGINRLGLGTIDGATATTAPLLGLNQYVGGASANGRVVRAEKSVRYDTPVFSGLSANVVFAPKAADSTTDGSTSNNNGFLNTTVNYVNGPLVVAYSTAKILADGHVAAGSSATGKLAANASVKHNALAANYTAGPVTVYAGLTTSKTDGNTANTSSAFTTFDVKSSNIAVKYAVTPTVDILANTVKVKDKIGSYDQSLNGVSAIYKLSKRTSAYYMYQKGDTNKSDAAKGAYTQNMVGLRHQF